MNTQKNIAIVGAGLVGSLLAINLIKRGYRVTVFERRGDMRKKGYEGGRSINLALSNRGLRALDEVGLADEIKKVAIPMHGRMMHDLSGKLTFQAYGKQGQFINSISRGNLNLVLMERAEQLGVQFIFEERITQVNLEKTTIGDRTFDYIVGADGAFSVVRNAFQITDRFNYSQEYIQHGYKEFHIPASKTGEFQMEQNALHIWPRESFMLIALPNPDGSFTCTLFFAFEGNLSFEKLISAEAQHAFFNTNFPDALALMPEFFNDFSTNPTSSLVTVRCFPWVKNKTLLVGDAAHAIVPFYGQGMNAGFEDCRVFNQLLDEHQDQWETALPAFQRLRKPDADAIAQLALYNFIEMRDLVGDADFLLRKKIEAKLYEHFPQRWIPLYSMVTFHENIRYSEALQIGEKQRKIMDGVMAQKEIEQNWMNLDLEKIIAML